MDLAYETANLATRDLPVLAQGVKCPQSGDPLEVGDVVRVLKEALCRLKVARKWAATVDDEVGWLSEGAVNVAVADQKTGGVK